jgi:hypothetical protein
MPNARGHGAAHSHAVNTVGVMGKGLALQFKRAYPAAYAEYRRACGAHEVKLGLTSRSPTSTTCRRLDHMRVLVFEPA